MPLPAIQPHQQPILQQLVSDADTTVRSAMADSRNACPEILALLADDDCFHVRHLVARRLARTGSSLLPILASNAVGPREAIAV